MSTPIRLMVVEDHPVTRQRFITMVKAYDDRFEVVAEAVNTEDALAQALKVRPQVVVTDLHFAPNDPTDGVELTRLLQMQLPDARVVMVTADPAERFMLMAHDAGVSAYLSKHCTASEIIRAIEAVASGFTHFPASLRAALEKRGRAPALTDRERQLLPLIARGLTAKEIARELSGTDSPNAIVDRTVKAHKGNIKRKLQLGSANALIAFAIQHCQDNGLDFRSARVSSTPKR